MSVPRGTSTQGGLLFFGLLLLLGLSAGGQTHQDVANLTGLDPNLFVELHVPVAGGELAIFAVYLNDRAFESRISSSLAQQLRPFVGKNALYINPTVKEISGSFPFQPGLLTVEQEGRPTFVATSGDWVEITPGFLAGGSQVNPAGAASGWGSKGILVLGDHIDGTRTFTLVYQGVRARLEIAAAAPPVPAAVAPREAFFLPLFPEVTDLGEKLTGGDLSQARVASLLGLDPSLVGTITVVRQQEVLQLVLVWIEAGIEKSTLRPDLIQALTPLLGQGMVMVWALSATGAAFRPWDLWVSQSGRRCEFWSDSSFAELTPGFLRTQRVEAGTVVGGVVRPCAWVDPRRAFEVHYSTAPGVSFPNVTTP